LLATAAIAVLNIATTAIMISHRRAGARAGAANGAQTASAAATPDESPPVGRLGVVLITAAFILLALLSPFCRSVRPLRSLNPRLDAQDHTFSRLAAASDT
jgi:hypothetical protein